MNKRNSFQSGSFKTRAESDGKYIEGYFAVYNQRTEIYPGFFEEIAPGAFDSSITNNDIRCLFNHNTDIVLGRTGNKTLELRSDNYGLYGVVHINEDDKQALDVYARVARGDIDGCSFGFYPAKEEYTELDGGNTLCRVLDTDTGEVSVCPFPAYPQTEIQARKKDFAEKKKINREAVKQNIKSRLEKLKC